MKIQVSEIDSSLPKSLQLYFDPTQSSLAPDHRECLRENLFQSLLKANLAPQENKILDLSVRPQHDQLSISVSHCPTAVALAWIDQPSRIGIDVESSKRLHMDLIKRIATSDEIKQCEAPMMLFCAKEATWKALSHDFKDKTLSHFITRSWTDLPTGWSSFKVSAGDKILDGQGFCRDFSGTYLCLFISPSTFV